MTKKEMVSEILDILENLGLIAYSDEPETQAATAGDLVCTVGNERKAGAP